jgi:transcriptional regulator with XRE-family HTH domain
MTQELFSDSKRARLKQARETAGMTLAELSLKSGYAVGTLSSIENGHDAPSNRLLEALINILRINRDWLDSGEGPPKVWSPAHWGGVKTDQIILEWD